MNRQPAISCPDWVRRAEPIEGVERIEAWFHGKAYAMHRHDTYAIGRTLAGVQSFNYRRSLRNSPAGHTMVLHPDEAHDGQAGTDEGFRYRMIYVEPALFQDVLGGRALPFLEGGVTTDARLAAATTTLLQHVGYRLEPLEQSDALVELTHAIAAVAGTPTRRPKGDFLAARRARDYLHVNCARVVTLVELEAATGRDRWSLSHDFRTFYGTSPYRYLTMRRLDTVRRMLLAGTSLAHAAAAAGFSDQSHMTRHFSKTFGLTPGRWLQVTGSIHRG
ncbi:TPA: AraC family transcriptional regulator [Burkholderia vietnamiensis]|uniref:AraC family transcriptional regulator n=2 Tax=Burkholderia vietnamiensis TaxID=60552 RepID=A0AA44Y7W3_BURVI|nr:AraC family transcriptional regulator [Burkholderia vietnamiensis]KVS16920.1 AraC family transcriptional regulator [Burkholderia vietnamiensis]MCA8211481.1 AraC family transcriptional regulator [Burkholderia vietnamiensis]PRH43607.1 AraC family transcriptional regulator [Burkholderia vietnamiensis]HDR9100365.1 AraC family transcriptional regulator [Burkholderia vietnamiensis]HDR9121666.1 AraC family transcriptional regulator [Burkholderia vietnamiensis]